MRHVVTLCCATALSCSLPALAKKPAPPAGQVSIESIATHGDGCPSGSAVAAISADAEAFTVGFSQFAAAVDPGATSPMRSGCSLHLKLSVPAGWSYALAVVDYIGYAALDVGVTASRQSTYHISGESPQQSIAYTWPGGFTGGYVVNDVGAGAPLYWSRCGKGKNLMIDTELAVDARANPAGSGLLTVDAVDGAVVHLLWRACK
jgi:hypothetical protein